MKQPYYVVGGSPLVNGYQDVKFKKEESYQFYGKKNGTKKINFKLYIFFCLSVFLTTSLIVKLIKIYTTNCIIEKSPPASFMCDFNIGYDEQLIIFGRTNSEERKEVCKFLSFLNDFNKTYGSFEEKKRRFEYFLKNVEIMSKKDNMDENVIFKVNKYSDWSDEELKKLLMSEEEIKNTQDISFEENSYLPIEFLPNEGDSKSHFDWRDKKVVTPVKDQGSCGSCAFFANVAAIESVNAIKGKPLTRLSEQELLDCDTRDNGCNGANRVNIFKYAKQNGVVFENYYQYMGRQSQCRNMTGKPRVYISGFKYLGRNENSWVKYLEKEGPFSVGVQVPKQMYYYSSGIFNPTEEDCKQRSLGSHAMAVIGYGEENGQKYWLLKNSWGQGYGFENGFIKMKRGVNSCGIANYAYGVDIKY